MAEVRSGGVLHCVSECRVVVYCAFTAVSLNLLKLAFCIHRHAEHIQFVPAGTQNMYILHLHALWTCIFVFMGHWICKFSDETLFVSPGPLLYLHSSQ